MSILRLVRNFALLAVLALAAHSAAARSHSNHSNLYGQECSIFRPHCRGGCKCSGGVFGATCVPKY